MSRLTRCVALIMAGGRGTRMARSHGEVPKPLVRVAGLPLLEICVRQLARAGVRDVRIAVHHAASAVMAWVQDHLRLPGVETSFLIEERPRGTIGSLNELRGETRSVLVTNGDLLSGIDLEHMAEFHHERRADLTIATHTELHRLKLGEVAVGPAETVVAYREKPVKEYCISSGVYLWSPAALARLGAGDYEALPDVANRLIAAGCQVLAYHHHEPWLDVNDADDLAVAEGMLRDDPVAFGIDPNLVRP